MNSSRQKRSRRRRCNTGVLAADISREQLEQWFHLPSHQACARLGISLSVLKRVCRKQGIPRWPYRAVGSTAWPSKDPSSSSSPPPETFATELTTSSSDHCGLAPMLPTSSSVPSSPVGQGAKHSSHSAHGREAQHASSSPAQSRREPKAGPADAAAPEGLDALLAAVAAVEPAAQPAPAAAAGKQVPAEPAASGAGIKAEPAWGLNAWLAASEGAHGEDWDCSCRAAGAGQVPHQPCSGCPPLPSLDPSWAGLGFAGLAARAGERPLDPPSPQQQAERPQQAQQHHDNVLAALEHSLRQHHHHAAVDAVASNQQWQPAGLLGWQQPAGQAGLGPSLLGGIDSASGTFPPSWLQPQQQQQLAAAEQLLQSRQHFLAGPLGSNNSNQQQQHPSQPLAPAASHSAFRPLQQLQLQALLEQQRQSHGELSLDPKQGIAPLDRSGGFAWGPDPQPSSITRLAFTSSSYPAATEASWQQLQRQRQQQQQQQQQVLHQGLPYAAATLKPAAAELAVQQQGFVGDRRAGSPWGAAAGGSTSLLSLATPAAAAAVAGGPTVLPGTASSPSPLAEGLLPQASALMGLLESGLGMMRSQPDHPLAAQLAAAMKDAVEAITLGANHMQGEHHMQGRLGA